MIVCLCRGVSDRTVLALIAAGAQTPDQVKKACGAGTDCGTCSAMLAELLEDTRGAGYRGMAASPHAPAGGLK